MVRGPVEGGGARPGRLLQSTASRSPGSLPVPANQPHAGAALKPGHCHQLCKLSGICRTSEGPAAHGWDGPGLLRPESVCLVGVPMKARLGLGSRRSALGALGTQPWGRPGLIACVPTVEVGLRAA